MHDDHTRGSGISYRIPTSDSDLESSPLKKQACTEKSTPSVSSAGSEVQSQPFFAQIFRMGRPILLQVQQRETTQILSVVQMYYTIAAYTKKHL